MRRMQLKTIVTNIRSEVNKTNIPSFFARNPSVKYMKSKQKKPEHHELKREGAEGNVSARNIGEILTSPSIFPYSSSFSSFIL